MPPPRKKMPALTLTPLKTPCTAPTAAPTAAPVKVYGKKVKTLTSTGDPSSKAKDKPEVGIKIKPAEPDGKIKIKVEPQDVNFNGNGNSNQGRGRGKRKAVSTVRSPAEAEDSKKQNQIENNNGRPKRNSVINKELKRNDNVNTNEKSHTPFKSAQNTNKVKMDPVPVRSSTRVRDTITTKTSELTKNKVAVKTQLRSSGRKLKPSIKKEKEDPVQFEKMGLRKRKAIAPIDKTPPVVKKPKNAAKEKVQIKDNNVQRSKIIQKKQTNVKGEVQKGKVQEHEPIDDVILLKIIQNDHCYASNFKKELPDDTANDKVDQNEDSSEFQQVPSSSTRAPLNPDEDPNAELNAIMSAIISEVDDNKSTINPKKPLIKSHNKPYRPRSINSSSNESKHSNKYRTCRICQTLFETTELFIVHQNEMHADKKPFSCTYCEKRFGTQSNKKEHERIHTGDTPYVCIIKDCNRGFTQISNLKKHMKIHGPDNDLCCETCLRQFTTYLALDKHLKKCFK